MTAKTKALFALLLSASALFASSCAFVKTDEHTEQESEVIDEKEEIEEKKDEEISPVTPEELENQPIEPVSSDDETVYEYINVTRNTKPDAPGLDFGDKFTSSFSIPQLKAESDNVKAFNEQLLALYPDLAFETDFTDDAVPTECTFNYSYSYDITDKAVVAIVITERLGYYYSEGYTSHTCFYYDLKNDCEVTAEVYLDAAGIDYETVKENASKTLHIRTATGDGTGSYDMRFADEYIEIGDAVMVSDTEGFVKTGFSNDYGYELVDIPTEEIVYEKARVTPNAHIYATPTPEAEVLGVLDGDTEVFVICEAYLPDNIQTIEFDDSFKWYAVEYGDIRGYMLEMELRF